MIAQAVVVDVLTTPTPAMLRHRIGLRRATTDDMNWLRDLYCAGRAEELALLAWTEDAKRAFLCDQFRLQHLHYMRTHADADHLIITCRTVSGGKSDVGRLYLDRTLRPWRLIEIMLEAASRKRGIGRILMQWLQGAACTSGAGAIDLHVARENVRARKFYERLGFREAVSLLDTHYRMAFDCRPDPASVD